MRTSARRAAIISAGIGFLAACAVIQPPPGGPEDTRPPGILATVPAADSAGVSRTVAPEIIFTEKVNPASFKNSIIVHPPVEFERLSIKGERLVIHFKGDLPETTVCLLIRAGIEDYHRVKSKQNFLLFFSTADSIAPGSISGVILFKEKPDSMGVAELFSATSDTMPDLRTAKRARVSFASRDGRFELRGLPTDGAKFQLRVFADRDGDGRYSEGKEFAAIYPQPITLGPSQERVEEILLNIIDPNEPGSIKGSVINETGISSAPMIRLSPVETGGAMFATKADSTGAFVLSRVLPGAYLFSAFIDIQADTLCGTYFEEGDTTRALTEPCVSLPDTLRVKPGEAKTLEPITIK